MKEQINRRVFINTAGVAVATGVVANSLAVGVKEPVGLANRDLWLSLSTKTAVCDLGHVDVLVGGGGPSGLAAAIQAARAGAKVLLVERYGRLGGMATLAMVNPLMGHVNSPLTSEIVQRLGGKCVDFETIDLHYADLLQESGAELLLHSCICGAIVENGCVKGVYLFGKGGADADSCGCCD